MKENYELLDFEIIDLRNSIYCGDDVITTSENDPDGIFKLPTDDDFYGN